MIAFSGKGEHMNYRSIIVILFLILSSGTAFGEAEVLIDARLIKIRLNEEHQQGIDWEAIVSNYERLDLSRSGKGGERNTRLSLGTVTNEDFVILLEALEVVGHMTDLINPKIRTSVDRAAKIVWDAHMPGNGFEIQIEISPHFQDGKLLAINLDPKLRWMTSRELTPGEPKDAVYFSSSGLDVKLKDDETIVIGGLMQEREIRRVSKFPLLGDLPLVGFAFRRQNRLIERTEYMIFLTPKILEKNEKE